MPKRSHQSIALRRIVPCILLPLLLGGCVSLFADKDCRDGKWHDVGYRDGGEGRHLLSHWQTTCGAFELPVDAAAYEQGHRDGLVRSYCTPDKAFLVGKTGGVFDYGQCGGRTDLRRPYETGLREYCAPAVALEAGRRAARYEFDRCGAAAGELRRAWQEGVTTGYCRPALAYQAGLDDRSFQLSLCPPNSESAFRTGLEVRSLRKSLDDIDGELYREKKKRDDGNAKDGERRHAEGRVRDLERERRRVREKLETLERLGRNY